MAKITKAQLAEIEASRENLRELLKPGDEVSTIVRHVSKSGMMRVIALKVFKDNRVYDISYNAAIATGHKLHPKYDGIKIEGCGMDMGFELVYQLGRALYPKGFELADNQYGRNGDKSGFDTDGGYALKHRWL